MNHSALVGLLFQLSNDIHFHHLNTLSYAEHKALEMAYNEINSLKDSLSEELIGLDGKLSPIKMLTIPSCSVEDLPVDILTAANSFREYGTSKKYNNVVNTSDEIAGLAARLKYLLKLS